MRRSKVGFIQCFNSLNYYSSHVKSIPLHTVDPFWQLTSCRKGGGSFPNVKIIMVKHFCLGVLYTWARPISPPEQQGGL